MKSMSYGKVIQSQDGSIKVGMKIAGVDIQSKMEEMKESAKKAATPIKDKITRNNDKVLPAIADLQAKANTFNQSFQLLGNYMGPAQGLHPNIFNNRVAVGTMSDDTAISSYMLLQPGANTSIGSVTIQVTQLASKDSIPSSLTISNPSLSLNAFGNLILNGKNIPLTADMSSQEVVDQINFYTSQSLIKAQLQKTTPTTYVINLSQTSTGTPIQIDDDQGGTLLTTLGLASSGKTSTQLSAQFTINNTDYTRTTNIVTDLTDELKGSTLTLLNYTDATANIDIDYDKSGIQNAIVNFVNQYNTINSIITYNKAMDSKGQPLQEDEFLFGSSLLRDLKRYMNAIIGTKPEGISESSLVQNLYDLGIRVGNSEDITDTNLSIDTQKLFSIVSSSPDQVAQFFQSTTTLNNSDFKVWGVPLDFTYTTDNGSGSYVGSPFTVSYTNTGGIYSATFTIQNGPTLTIPNVVSNFIQGSDVFNGLKLEYCGADLQDGDTKTLTLVITKGFANDVILNTVTQNILPLFKNAIDGISQQNKTYQQQIKRIEQDADVKFTIPPQKMDQLIRSSQQAQLTSRIIKTYMNFSNKNI